MKHLNVPTLAKEIDSTNKSLTTKKLGGLICRVLQIWKKEISMNLTQTLPENMKRKNTSHYSYEAL